LFYRLWWLILTGPIRLYWRVRVTGRENLPKRGGIILASNHQSGLDPVVVGGVLSRPIYWLAKVEYVVTPKQAWFFKSVGVIPVNRDAPEHEALEHAAACVRSGKQFGIYPEGTRSPDGRVYKGYTGVARIAEMSGAAVIPIGVMNTREALPKGKIMARPLKCEVRIGPALHFKMGTGEDPHEAYRRFTDEVMDAIASLTGKERVDHYSREPKRNDAGEAASA
jgi:1-acyl-sn-glycerol-3-phosphate acyltransferase